MTTPSRSTLNQGVEARTQSLETERDRLRQSESVLSLDARRDSARRIQNFELDLQRFIEDAQAEFLGVQREVELDFQVKLLPIIEQVAQENDLHFVFTFPTAGLFWADDRYDLTGDIVQRLDEAATADD